MNITLFELGQVLAGFRNDARDTAAPYPEIGVFNVLNLILKEMRTMSDKIDALMKEQTQLATDVGAQTTVIASATTALTGLTAQLAAAEAAAKAAGVTDEQIASFTAVRTSLESNTAALAAAIPQNTPAATEPAPATPVDPNAPATGQAPAPGNVAPADPVVPPPAALPADTTTQPAPADASAGTHPAAPTGTETPL